MKQCEGRVTKEKEIEFLFLFSHRGLFTLALLLYCAHRNENTPPPWNVHQPSDKLACVTFTHVFTLVLKVSVFNLSPTKINSSLRRQKLSSDVPRCTIIS